MDGTMSGSGASMALAKMLRSGFVGKSGQPGRQIDDVHSLSVSRVMAVSMPRNQPLRALAGCMGMNSTRLSNCTTCILTPGASFSPARTTHGMTTLNLGETATVCIVKSQADR